MKPEEAVERLKVALRCYEYATDKDFAALIEVTKAFEKETPKKPIYGTDNWTQKPRCSVCNNLIRYVYGMKYCPSCGHAIDWGYED